MRDMSFLGDVKIKCESCEGRRYKEKVLRYMYKKHTIVDVLLMTAQEIKDFFDDKIIKAQMKKAAKLWGWGIQWK